MGNRSPNSHELTVETARPKSLATFFNGMLFSTRQLRNAVAKLARMSQREFGFWTTARVYAKFTSQAKDILSSYGRLQFREEGQSFKGLAMLPGSVQKIRDSLEGLEIHVPMRPGDGSRSVTTGRFRSLASVSMMRPLAELPAGFC